MLKECQRPILEKNERGQPIRNPKEALSKQIQDTLSFLRKELQPGAFVDAPKLYRSFGAEGAEKLDRFNREEDITNVAKKVLVRLCEKEIYPRIGPVSS